MYQIPVEYLVRLHLKYNNTLVYSNFHSHQYTAIDKSNFEYNDFFFSKISTNILHGSPSRTMLHVIYTMLFTHIRIQSLKSVFEVLVFGRIHRQYVLEPTMIILGRVSKRHKKFRWSNRKSTNVVKDFHIKCIHDEPSMFLLHEGG